MTASSSPEIYVATSLGQAVDALDERGTAGAPLAGGTWIMRAPLRGEAFRRAYVALSTIPALKAITFTDAAVEVGAGVTHAELAKALDGVRGLEALAVAAGTSANPAVRATATVGGNLATVDFPAADLVPALLAVGAEVEVAGKKGADRMGIAAFLRLRADPGLGGLLTKVVIPRWGGRSAHARLPLRKAGDYPVAIVSLAVALDAAGRIETIRIGVGSVEQAARRWTGLEAALIGEPLDPDGLAGLAKAHAGEFTGRDGIEAPGWYRVSVLPTLMRRAAAALIAAA